MRRIVVSAAFLALAGIAPAMGERLFVPLVGATDAEGRALATEIWVANGAMEKATVRAGFLGGARREARDFAVEGGGRMLDRMAGADAVGLVAIDGDEAAVSAWIPDRWGTSVSEVPVIGPHDSYVAGATPGLELARDYDRLLVGAANLSREAASCQAVLFGEGFVELGRFTFEVPAESLVRRDAAGEIGVDKATYAEVGCNRSFYPVGVTTTGGDRGNSVIAVAKGIGPNGDCTQTLTLAQPAGSTNYIAQTTLGLFHTVTKKDPKGILCIKAPKELRIGQATFEWDVTAAPWSKRNKSGLHALGYYFLDRYRSGVVGNVLAAGPNKSFIKFMQNVGMPPKSNTNAKSAYELQPGVTYHFEYTFDAVNKKATLRAFFGSTMISDFSKETRPGNNQTLIVKPYNPQGLAMVAEFSNYFGQHPPEEAAENWKFHNFRVVMVPK